MLFPLGMHVEHACVRVQINVFLFLYVIKSRRNSQHAPIDDNNNNRNNNSNSNNGYIYIYVYVCMSVCLSVCLSVCMYACMHACMYVCISIYLSIYRSIYLSILPLSPYLTLSYLYPILSTHLSICVLLCSSHGHWQHAFNDLCTNIFTVIYLITISNIYIYIYVIQETEKNRVTILEISQRSRGLSFQ